MAENVQETRPPEPPLKPPEVPKPTEQEPNRPDVPVQRQESQQSAQQDARNAASVEHAKATAGPEPDGIWPTPELQERLNAHTAERPQDSRATQPSQDVGGTPPVSESEAAQHEREAPDPAANDRNTDTLAGEHVGEHAAARETAAAERAKATKGANEAAKTEDRSAAQHSDGSQDSETAPDLRDGGVVDRRDAAAPPGKHEDEVPAVDEQAGQSPETTAEPGDGSLGSPDSSYNGPDRRQYDAQHLDPASDLRTNVPETAIDDLVEVGDGSGPWFDEGTNHREGGAVQQMTEGSCVSASGEMLTDGRITQPELLSELGDWSNLSALRNELNNRDGDGSWTGKYFEDGNAALLQASEGPMAAQVQAPFGRAHMVILEPGEKGSFTVRDPYEGSSYDVDRSWVENM